MHLTGTANGYRNYAEVVEALIDIAAKRDVRTQPEHSGARGIVASVGLGAWDVSDRDRKILQFPVLDSICSFAQKIATAGNLSDLFTASL